MYNKKYKKPLFSKRASAKVFKQEEENKIYSESEPELLRFKRLQNPGISPLGTQQVKFWREYEYLEPYHEHGYNQYPNNYFYGSYEDYTTEDSYRHGSERNRTYTTETDSEYDMSEWYWRGGEESEDVDYWRERRKPVKSDLTYNSNYREQQPRRWRETETAGSPGGSPYRDQYDVYVAHQPLAHRALGYTGKQHKLIWSEESDTEEEANQQQYTVYTANAGQHLPLAFQQQQILSTVDYNHIRPETSIGQETLDSNLNKLDSNIVYVPVIMVDKRDKTTQSKLISPQSLMNRVSEQAEKLLVNQTHEQAEKLLVNQTYQQAEKLLMNQAHEQAEKLLMNQTHEQAEKLLVNQTHQQAEKLLMNQTHEQAEKLLVNQTHGQTKKQLVNQTHRQTEQQLVNQTHGQTEKLLVNQTNEQAGKLLMNQTSERAEKLWETEVQVFTGNVIGLNNIFEQAQQTSEEWKIVGNIIDIAEQQQSIEKEPSKMSKSKMSLKPGLSKLSLKPRVSKMFLKKNISSESVKPKQYASKENLSSSPFPVQKPYINVLSNNKFKHKVDKRSSVFNLKRSSKKSQSLGLSTSDKTKGNKQMKTNISKTPDFQENFNLDTNQEAHIHPDESQEGKGKKKQNKANLENRVDKSKSLDSFIYKQNSDNMSTAMLGFNKYAFVLMFQQASQYFLGLSIHEILMEVL